MFHMLTSLGHELQKAHGPMVRSGSFCTFSGRWEDLMLSPFSFFRLLQGLGSML